MNTEFLYSKYYSTLVGSVYGHSPDLANHAEDIVHDVFVNLQKRGTSVLGVVSLASLLKHTRQKSIDWVRARDSNKRGGEIPHCPLDLAPECVGSRPTNLQEQEESLQASLLIEMIDRVIDATLPSLSERERILIRHIRKWSPAELTCDELAAELTPFERERFLPVRRDCSLEEAELLVKCQISRSKSTLQRKLRETRDSLGL